MILISFLSLQILSSWTEPLNISNTDSMSLYPEICVDKRGWVHCVFQDNTRTGYNYFELLYTYNDGTGWIEPIYVYENPSYYPVVIVDTLNRVHIAWDDLDSGRIKWTYFDGDTWTEPVSVTSDVPYQCGAARFSLDPFTGYIHMVFCSGGEYEIWYKFFDGTSWSPAENVSSDTATSSWADIAVDKMGRVHIVWMDYETYDVFYRMKDENGWGEVIHLQPYTPSTQSCDPKIAVDLNNNPHIVWEERTSPEYVIYTYFDGSGWNIIKVDSGEVGLPVIAMDMYDRAHIIYFKDYKLYYVCYDGTTKIRGPEMINPSDPVNALIPAIAVDNQYIHCVFSEGKTPYNGTNEIWYSYREMPSFIEEYGRLEDYSSMVYDEFSFSFSLDKISPKFKIYCNYIILRSVKTSHGYVRNIFFAFELQSTPFRRIHIYSWLNPYYSALPVNKIGDNNSFNIMF